MVAVTSGRPLLNYLRTSRLPIFTQLHLEEALLRGTSDNWLLVNDGAFNPSIVVGISGWVAANRAADPTLL
jgi:hypothetical protein